MREDSDLDLVLKTRLDVLDQAVEEVKCVIAAVTAQHDRLAKVRTFLADGHDGEVDQAVKNLREHTGDVHTRARLLLDSLSPPPPAARPEGPPRPAASLSTDDRRRLERLLECAESLTRQIDQLEKSRADAYASFRDMGRWSVAGLGNKALQEAVKDYQLLIDQIRAAPRPWKRYQSEMPRLDHKLFSRYLELVASMAVRGFGLDPKVQSDVRTVIGLVKGPEQDATAEPLRSPLALMSSLGRRHMPLGYPEWSLWALPLLGRTASERVDSLLPPGVSPQLRVICSDLYAQYVLGPSYLHAAVFLEFDPRAEPPRANLPPDSLRVTVLLQNLREHSAGDSIDSQLIESIAAPVEREWRRARTAFGGQERDLSAADRRVADQFLRDLEHEYFDSGYRDEKMADLPDVARDLLTDRQGPSESRDMRDLLGAMWVARLMDPSQAREIHRRARKVPLPGEAEPTGHGGYDKPTRNFLWA